MLEIFNAGGWWWQIVWTDDGPVVDGPCQYYRDLPSQRTGKEG